MVDVQKYKEDLQEAIVQSDVVKIFDNLLTIGVEEGVSDIHIEPFENYSRIRLRLDGVLYELTQYPQNIHDSIIAKFKIESGQMRPDEKRLPQDARVSTLTLTNKEIDLRANTLPTVWGEKLVMRIVDKSKKTPPLEVLGIEGINNKILFRNLVLPSGIIMTTGPTGSGKTTTLYAGLEKLNKIEVNITTYEDPVESKVNGLNQSQIRSDIGYTFAQGLRAALRQDPDIIMVGEIRDFETLETAMEAAMTGHLVFSTIHTNSAAETITRVINIGAKPYMISGTFNLIMAQRLGRKICDECKVEVNVKEKFPQYYKDAKKTMAYMDKEMLKSEINLRGINPKDWSKFVNDGIMYAGSGKSKDGTGICKKCKGTGYKGRVGIYEMMEYSDELRNLLLQGKTAYELEQFSLKNGMINLERDGVLKAIGGKTTLEEIYRLTKHKKYLK